jgi:hypothetical protein
VRAVVEKVQTSTAVQDDRWRRGGGRTGAPGKKGSAGDIISRDATNDECGELKIKDEGRGKTITGERVRPQRGRRSRT